MVSNMKRLACVVIALVVLGLAGPVGASDPGSIYGWGLQVVGPTGKLTAIAAGGGHSLGLKSDGSIAAWGSNSYGQCDMPVPNTGFVAIAAGGYNSLGLKDRKSVV